MQLVKAGALLENVISRNATHVPDAPDGTEIVAAVPFVVDKNEHILPDEPVKVNVVDTVCVVPLVNTQLPGPEQVNVAIVFEDCRTGAVPAESIVTVDNVLPPISQFEVPEVAVACRASVEVPAVKVRLALLRFKQVDVVRAQVIDQVLVPILIVWEPEPDDHACVLAPEEIVTVLLLTELSIVPV